MSKTDRRVLARQDCEKAFNSMLKEAPKMGVAFTTAEWRFIRLLMELTHVMGQTAADDEREIEGFVSQSSSTNRVN